MVGVLTRRARADETTYDLSSDSIIVRWARGVGMDPSAMTIEQACAAMNATQTGLFTVSVDGRSLSVAPVAAPTWSSTIVDREPNPLRHNPLTPDPAGAGAQP